MRLALRLGIAALGAMMLLIGPAQADSRDDALTVVRALSEQITSRLANGQLSDGDLWAGVQGLSDAFNRFTLSETEYRSEEKVAPPLLSSLRPGEAEPIENTRPGARIALGEVPQPWFTKTVSDAQRALERVRGLLENEAPPAEMLTALSGFGASLDLIDRPPES